MNENQEAYGGKKKKKLIPRNTFKKENELQNKIHTEEVIAKL